MLGPILDCQPAADGRAIRLIPVSPEHLCLFRAGFDRLEISRYLSRGFALSDAQEQEWFDRNEKEPTKVIWSIECDGTVVGNAALFGIDYRVGHATCGLAILLPDYWGKGIATRVMHARARYAFEELNLCCLYTEAYEPNEGSWRAARKIGYCEYGRKPFAGFTNGQHMTSILAYLTPDMLKIPV